MEFLLFIKITLVDVVDILLVTFLIYQVYNLIKGTAALNIFFGIVALYLLYLVVKAMEMRLLSQILGQFIGIGTLALVIVFQQEIRRFLLFVGSTGVHTRWKIFRRFFYTDSTKIRPAVNFKEVAAALRELGSRHIGALMVFLKESELKYSQKDGVPIQAKLSAPLILQIFHKNTPLHDGAIVIRDNTILTARCVLPLTEKTDFPAKLGLRHRAAVGITEMSDAIAVVVSEQTGEYSIAYKGELHLGIPLEDLMKKLEEYLSVR